jgi:excisionase family DNA binding protein
MPADRRQRRPIAAAAVSRPPIESPYLTPAEAIVYLRCGSRSALQRLITEHRLPYCRRGRKLLLDKRDIDKWLHQNQQLVGADFGRRHG